MVAGIRARTLAFTIDLLIFIAAAPFTIGLAALVLRPWWPIGAAAIGLGYCVAGACGGQSPGMRLAGVRLVDSRTGHEPSLRQSLLRGLLIVAPLGAVFVLLSAPIPAPGDSSSGTQGFALAACLALVALGAIDHLWVYGNRQRRTLHDRLSTTAVLQVAEDRR